MHMADALLSPAVGGTMWAGSLALLGWCSRKVREVVDRGVLPYMGVLGAFVFAAQMINFTIPATGSSGHLGGGLLLAVFLGPHAAFLVIASVLVVQALFFADGGLLALGCNIWNLGLYPCFVAFPLIYRPLVRGNPSRARLTAAALLSAVVALQLGAFSVVVETRLSGISELPFRSFLLFMQPVHLAIGVVEGLVTAAVILAIGRIDPGALELTREAPAGGGRKALLVFGMFALVTGGVLSWFASTHPDGLEWSIDRISGAPEVPGRTDGLHGASARIQDRTALLPDYGFPSAGEPEEKAVEAWPAVDPGTSLSGVLGGLLVVLFVSLLGMGLRFATRPGREGGGTADGSAPGRSDR